LLGIGVTTAQQHEQRAEGAAIAAAREPDQRLVAGLLVRVVEPSGERLAHPWGVHLQLRPEREGRPVAHVVVGIGRQLDEGLHAARVRPELPGGEGAGQPGSDRVAHRRVRVAPQPEQRRDRALVAEEEVDLRPVELALVLIARQQLVSALWS
jgi:hypothetical protein